MQMTNEQQKLCDQCSILQRNFVINLISGMTQRKAYLNAGGRAKNKKVADQSASRLFRKIKVKAFYSSLLDRKINESLITRFEALKILSNIARSNINDIVSYSSKENGKDADGHPIIKSTLVLKDPNLMTQASVQAIEEISSNRCGLKIKTHSKLQAIKQIAEMEGWNTSNKHSHHIIKEHPISPIHSDEDIARKVVFLLCKAEKSQKGMGIIAQLF